MFVLIYNVGTTWGIQINSTKFGKYLNYLGIIKIF